MSQYNSLKTTIDANIKQNGIQAITGNILNAVLNAMVNSLGANYHFCNVAIPETDPGSPDQKVFYFASTPGIYTNFGGIVINPGELALLCYDSSWTKKTIVEFNETIKQSVLSQLVTGGNNLSDLGMYRKEKLYVRSAADWATGSLSYIFLRLPDNVENYSFILSFDINFRKFIGEGNNFVVENYNCVMLGNAGYSFPYSYKITAKDGATSIVEIKSVTIDGTPYLLLHNGNQTLVGEFVISNLSILSNNSSAKIPDIYFNEQIDILSYATPPQYNIVANLTIDKDNSRSDEAVKELARNVIEENATKDLMQNLARNTIGYGHYLIDKPFAFTNKTCVFFGDSITAGIQSNPFGICPNPYAKVFTTKAGLSFENQAVSGTYFCEESSSGITRKILDYTTPKDYIFIAGGVNDAQVQSPIGILGDTTMNTVYGALHMICEHIKTSFPNSKVIFITPINLCRRDWEGIPITCNKVELIRKAIFETAIQYDFNVVDGADMCMPDDLANPQTKTLLLEDGIHPTELGHRVYGNKLYQVLTT